MILDDFAGDEQKKREIIKRVTEGFVSVEGEGLHEKTVVVVEERKSGNWAIGGIFVGVT